jgi:hypothetical protein
MQERRTRKKRRREEDLKKKRNGWRYEGELGSIRRKKQGVGDLLKKTKREIDRGRT